MSDVHFLSRIARSAALHGERPAYTSGDKIVSYSELFALASGIRKAILEKKGIDLDRIGIVTSDDAATYASLLAAWSIGAAYVPLNAHNPPERNARIIEQAGLTLILSARDSREWCDHLPDSIQSGQILATKNVRPGPAKLPFPDRSPSDLAYLFFTSGSTGMPKGVPISHGNLSAFMSTVLDATDYNFNESDRFLQMFELTFDLSVASTLLPWSVGACCCVVPERGIAYLNILKTLNQQQVTVALMVPSVLPYLQRFFDEIRLPHLRLNQFCGEAMMQDMAHEWSKCVPRARIENVYGPTEATIYCTRYEWLSERAAEESVNGIVPIGIAMPGTHTFVIDDQGNRCDPGIRGELCLAGTQVMSGYWENIDKTEQSFITLTVKGKQLRAYRTGDVAYFNSDGVLVYCGRKDSQVKIDGHRIELGEIEFFARQFINSSAAAVVAVHDETGTDRLTLFVAGPDIDCVALEQFLKANLPAYMLPNNTTVLPELPLNLNGKIDRPALSRLAAQ